MLDPELGPLLKRWAISWWPNVIHRLDCLMDYYTSSTLSLCLSLLLSCTCSHTLTQTLGDDLRPMISVSIEWLISGLYVTNTEWDYHQTMIFFAPHENIDIGISENEKGLLTHYCEIQYCGQLSSAWTSQVHYRSIVLYIYTQYYEFFKAESNNWEFCNPTPPVRSCGNPFPVHLESICTQLLQQKKK